MKNKILLIGPLSNKKNPENTKELQNFEELNQYVPNNDDDERGVVFSESSSPENIWKYGKESAEKKLLIKMSHFRIIWSSPQKLPGSP